VPVADVSKFEKEFLDYVGRQHKGIYDGILSGGKVEGDIVEQLQNAISDFKKQFETSSGEAIGGDELKAKVSEAAEAAGDDADSADNSADDASDDVAEAEDNTADKADAASERTEGSDDADKS
jgi:hypothetical protein